MAVYERMFEASFKGATFLISGAVETAGGRKLVDHIYPNSPRRFIEDMDLLRRDFTFTGVIREPRYHSKRDLLIKKLEEGGAGQLVHPFLGKFNVVARPYILTENTTQLGRAEFQLVFAVADNNVFPKDGGQNKFVKFLEEGQAAITDLLDGIFGANSNDNFGPAGALLDDIGDAFDAVQSTVAVVADGVNAAQDALVQFKNKTSAFVQGIESLGSSVNNLFNNFGTIAGNAFDQLKVFEKMFGFSSTPRVAFSQTDKFGVTKQEDAPLVVMSTDIPDPDAIVPEDNLSQMQPLGSVRQENIDNANVINVSMNASALLQMYFFAQKVEYETDEDLNKVAVDLESRYLELVELINDDLLEAINNMRNEWIKFVTETLLTIARVIEIEIGPTNVTKLVNDLYGNTDKYDQIIDLNNVVNPSEIQGTVKVVSS